MPKARQEVPSDLYTQRVAALNAAVIRREELVARRRKKAKEWRHFIDALCMGLKAAVAGAFIGIGAWIWNMPEPKVIGTLPSSAVTYTVEQAQKAAWVLALISGCYVLGSLLMGLGGRMLRVKALYGMYWCSNVLGVSLCLFSAILPTIWGTSLGSYCLVAENRCAFATDALHCPYTSSSAHLRLLEEPSHSIAAMLMPARRLWEGGRMLGSGDLQCCYDHAFVRTCERFFGAYWTLCVVGTILALVVGLQSSVACCYLCCSRELEAEVAEAEEAVAAMAKPLAINEGGVEEGVAAGRASSGEEDVSQQELKRPHRQAPLPSASPPPPQQQEAVWVRGEEEEEKGGPRV